MERLIQLDATGNVEVRPEALMFSEYAAVWEADKTQRKENAKRELSYVWFVCSLDKENPYKDKKWEIRLEDVRKDIMPKGWKPTKRIKDAIERFKENNYDDNVDMLEAVKYSIDQMKTYFKTINLSATDDVTGKPLHSAKDLRSNIEGIAKLLKSVRELKEEIKRGMESEDTNIRGGGELGIIESEL